MVSIPTPSNVAPSVKSIFLIIKKLKQNTNPTKYLLKQKAIDDKDGHFIVRVNENLTQRCK